jgi:hypothetical protein
VCNASVDDDCDGLADDADPNVDLTGAPTWYLDTDDDGYGAGTGSKRCVAPSADHVQVSGDCLDSGSYAALTAPGAAESCDGLRTNCNLASVPATEVDHDADGFVECNVAAGPGWRAGGTPPGGLDCDDTNTWGSDVYPGATERCVNDRPRRDAAIGVGG